MLFLNPQHYTYFLKVFLWHNPFPPVRFSSTVAQRCAIPLLAPVSKAAPGRVSTSCNLMKCVVLKCPSRFYQLLLQGEILMPRPSRADKQLFLVEKLLWSCEFSCFNKLHEASRFLFLWLFFFFFCRVSNTD